MSLPAMMSALTATELLKIIQEFQKMIPRSEQSGMHILRLLIKQAGIITKAMLTH